MIRKSCVAAHFHQIRLHSGIFKVLRTHTLEPFNAKNNLAAKYFTFFGLVLYLFLSHIWANVDNLMTHHYFQEKLQWRLSRKMLSCKTSVVIKQQVLEITRHNEKIRGFFLVSGIITQEEAFAFLRLKYKSWRPFFSFEQAGMSWHCSLPILLFSQLLNAHRHTYCRGIQLKDLFPRNCLKVTLGKWRKWLKWSGSTDVDW